MVSRTRRWSRRPAGGAGRGTGSAATHIANDWRTERGIKLLDNVIKGDAILTPVDIERLQGRLLNIQERARAALGESPVAALGESPVDPREP